MDVNGWASDLIAITGRLIELMRREIEMLRVMRPSGLKELQEEKSALARLYEQQIKALRESPVRLTALASVLKDELVAVTRHYEKTLTVNAQALKAARDANEGLLKAIVDAASQGRSTTYSSTGTRTSARKADAEPVSLAIDQRF